MAMRLIHIGIGTRGRHWLDIVADYPEALSVACVDPDQNALEAVARQGRQADVRRFDDLDRALRDVAADVALIASPSSVHVEHAIRALEAGLHVMVEKPLALSLKEAQEVVQTAQAVKRHVVVAENYRFFPAERTARRLIAEGRIGRIGVVTCVDRRRQPPSDLGRWASALPYPQITEIAVHHFDSFRYLLARRPVSVTARSFNPPDGGYRSGAGTQAIIEMEGGLSILYSGTMCSHRYEYALWIEGETGSLWTDRKRVWWRDRGAHFFRPVRLHPVPRGDGHRYPKGGTTSLLNHLRDAVLHDVEPETAGRDNLWTVSMLEAGIRSMEEFRAVSIAELQDGLLRNGSVSAPPIGHGTALDLIPTSDPIVATLPGSASLRGKGCV